MTDNTALGDESAEPTTDEELEDFIVEMTGEDTFLEQADDGSQN